MKDFLPSGNIITSNNTDLDSYFGFCYCTVTDYLDKPILPYRVELGNICNPIGSRAYSSEILKKAKELGVEIEVIACAMVTLI
jgi:hypothetical protein